MEKNTCSSPSWRAPKSHLAVEQLAVNRRMLNLLKTDTSCPKTKKPQQDSRRGTIMIKSNPIPPRWMTHRLENSNTKEVLPLFWRFRTPCQGSQPGDLTKGLGTPRDLTLKASGTWLQDFHGTGGNRDFSLGGHKQNLANTKTQRKGAVNPQETEPKLPASFGRSPVEEWVELAGAYYRDRGTGSRQQLFGKVPFRVNSLGVCH